MLTLQFLPYHEIENLPSAKRIKKILDIVKEDKIVVLEGRLKKEEEAELIKDTMEKIDQNFRGIELSVIYPKKRSDLLVHKLKNLLINVLFGERQGLTVIGPASLIKEIKQDPNRIQMHMFEEKKKKKK